MEESLNTFIIALIIFSLVILFIVVWYHLRLWYKKKVLKSSGWIMVGHYDTGFTTSSKALSILESLLRLGTIQQLHTLFNVYIYCLNQDQYTYIMVQRLLKQINDTVNIIPNPSIIFYLDQLSQTD